MQPAIKNRQYVQPWVASKQAKAPFEQLQGKTVSKQDINGIGHLNQLSKLGAHLRHISHTQQKVADPKEKSAIT
jgi:hypothetical protein